MSKLLDRDNERCSHEWLEAVALPLVKHMVRFRSARMQVGDGARRWLEVMAELDAEAADADNDEEPSEQKYEHDTTTPA